jgi:hypothetical protein
LSIPTPRLARTGGAQAAQDVTAIGRVIYDVVPDLVPHCDASGSAGAQHAESRPHLDAGVTAQSTQNTTTWSLSVDSDSYGFAQWHG